MTLTNPKRFYSRFLKGHAGKLHFRAHSHDFWPDVSREAQIAYWDDCAMFGDEKWNRIFSETIENARPYRQNPGAERGAANRAGAQHA